MFLMPPILFFFLISTQKEIKEQGGAEESGLAAEGKSHQPKADTCPFIAAKQAKKVTIRDAIFHKI